MRVIDEFLEQAPLGRGARSFLEAMRASSMRLYEVMETVPGVSVALRDLVEGGEVTVAERTASRQLVRHECLAARVLPRGCSGQAELERGLLRIPELIREGLVSAAREERQQYFAERPGASLRCWTRRRCGAIWNCNVFLGVSATRTMTPAASPSSPRRSSR